MQAVAARLPIDVVREVERIAAEEKLDKSSVLARATAAYVKHWKFERALRLYEDGKVTALKVADLAGLSSLVDVKMHVRAIEEDPSDNHVLACAKEAGAQFIISGDRHLLQLGQYEGIKILTAATFIRMGTFGGAWTGRDDISNSGSHRH